FSLIFSSAIFLCSFFFSLFFKHFYFCFLIFFVKIMMVIRIIDDIIEIGTNIQNILKNMSIVLIKISKFTSKVKRIEIGFANLLSVILLRVRCKELFVTDM